MWFCLPHQTMAVFGLQPGETLKIKINISKSKAIVLSARNVGLVRLGFKQVESLGSMRSTGRLVLNHDMK